MRYTLLIIAGFIWLGFNQTYAQTNNANTGFASFYHDAFNGKRTASGEILSQKKATCAHRTFPFGTKLKVTNLENGKTAVVTVTDRGPFVRGRIIDVTQSVAKTLGFWAEGQAKVSLEIMSCEGITDSTYNTADTINPFYKIESIDNSLNGFSVKVASFYIEEKALEVIRDLKLQTKEDVYLQTVLRNDKVLYRIFAGRFKTKTKAEELQEKIKTSYSDCYVVELTK